ncbi:hypothetical protein Pa4123_11480 [Phytohabitans aurantiacus]|uniref:DUF4760 domain-containing protein n=1 Tax=Phytohabitans aurantiacus TaxID=3016789 RepID=A0ABQ5QME4_9ACTN|nr:hypothetical protein Pa4123_11480 [Phytohabitans aurantiacus]
MQRRPATALLSPLKVNLGILATSILLILAVALIVASPLALRFLDSEEHDWERLSLIGQSYGAISAVLAAAAVIAVAMTLGLQQRQMRDARRMAIRQFQTDLLAMAINDPDLLQAWGQFPRPEGVEPRLTVYTNLVLNYFILLHQTGAANIDEIRMHLRFMATSEWVRSYWQSTEDVWRTGYPSKKGGIIAVFSEELGTSPQAAQQEPPAA